MTDHELLARMIKVDHDPLYIFSSAEYRLVIRLLISSLRDYEAAYPHGRLGEAARNLLGHA